MTRRRAPVAESFHSHHAPLGAYATFTLGLVAAPGGFGHALGGPARQNVYIGFRTAAAGQWQLLPFFAPTRSSEAAFVGEAGKARPPSNLRPLRSTEIARRLGWASDTWRADDSRFGFSILSPFGKVSDPARLSAAEARRAFSPHVNGWIEYDNRRGKAPVQLLFGVGEPDSPFRPLEDGDPSLLGFAIGTRFAYATQRRAGVEGRQGFDVFTPRFGDVRGLHRLGAESALVFTVPPGARRRFPLVFAFHEAGTLTSGIRARYAYTRWFPTLEDVIRHGLGERAHYERIAARRDRELERARLDVDQRFLIAQATHSYLGNTQLLWDGRRYSWVVNEGEYRMMNTFDLAVDHLFFELRWFPWAVRSVLDLYRTRYSYTDRLHAGGGRTAPGGISFTHDMGVNLAFTPPGRSSYECVHQRACFSQMTMEQLVNWVLCAVVYAEHAGDLRWLRRNLPTLRACAESLRRRDDPEPGRRNGVLAHDSVRCGDDGAEITTYDSLDASLGQARNNLYLSVKTLGAWILLEHGFGRLGSAPDAKRAAAAADLLAATLVTWFDPESGTFPAVFEGGNQSRILPAIEGLAYPLFLGLDWATSRDGRFATLLERLERHLRSSLRRGVCLDATTGAWKMSSTSTNTWFSKIALAQYVARRLFPSALGAAARAADRVHADWQRRPGCGAYAMCDQIRSDTGLACGSRYYPRGVTSILWLAE
jgi:hypothetical protein